MPQTRPLRRPSQLFRSFFQRCAWRALGGGLLLALAAPAWAAGGADWPWWSWPLVLFAACFVMGIIAVPAGIGGGTLFVPIVGSFFPFHLDFVRGAGLLVALASALAAGPMLLRSGLGSLRLALPLAVLASASSIGGAMLGLALPPQVVQVLLAVVVLGIVAFMFFSKKSEFPQVDRPDPIAQALALNGVFLDGATGRTVNWQVHRTVPGLLVFLVIGALAGMFGIGAGWANVPALNLLMGAPLKVSAGTSGLVLSLVDSSAAWVYLNQGAVLPMIAVPSVAGMMLGARIGARLLHVLKAAVIRRLVIGVLLFAGLRALFKGLGVWP
ncbi:MAG: sulfite exporter TauE/SafE family protein [Betaproteobacteria bacterium]|nr:sulfite exporter TauE/SafE family protein [Betaproteobacteria bacterium]